MIVFNSNIFVQWRGREEARTYHFATEEGRALWIVEKGWREREHRGSMRVKKENGDPCLLGSWEVEFQGWDEIVGNEREFGGENEGFYCWDFCVAPGLMSTSKLVS